ncbi:hypothetical protein CcaverHIS631_0602930 [Cutaneotrichosporon cavernicola]|nr:hypothetical protein CcaverHIS631_0602930 [Cutaneotrichosporon cavernicola]BEJ09379.1 hypothetical protein CcaverHIS641_0602940 [Cutaneotrichosporon cavernicola]
MPPTQPRESELTRTEPLRLYQLIREPSSTGVSTTHPGRTSVSSSTRTLDSTFSTDTRARRVPLWQGGRRRRVPGSTADAAIPTHRMGRTALHRSNTFRNWDGSVPELVLRDSSQRMSAVELEARYQSYLQDHTPAVTFPVASSNSLPQTTSASVNILHPDRPPYLPPMRWTNNSDEGNGARRQYGRLMSIPFSPLRDVVGQLESAAVGHTRPPDLADFVHPEFSFTHRGVPDLAVSDHELSEVEQQRMRQTVDPYSLPLTFPLLPSPRRLRAESIPTALRSHYGSIAAGSEPAFNLPWFTPGPYSEIPPPLVRSGPLVDSSEALSGTSRAEARAWLRLGERHADRLRALVHPRTSAEQARADTARSTAPYLYAESLEIIEGLIGAIEGVLDSDTILVDQTLEAATERAVTETDSDDGSLPPPEIGECDGDTEGNNLDYHCYARWIAQGWRCYFCRREM